MALDLRVPGALTADLLRAWGGVSGRAALRGFFWKRPEGARLAGPGGMSSHPPRYQDTQSPFRGNKHQGELRP